MFVVPPRPPPPPTKRKIAHHPEIRHYHQRCHHRIHCLSIIEAYIDFFFKMHNTPRDTMIRHSGRALIRGKIRRVWRPRFLQLCDNGLVRYYECTSEQNILKCTLVIYSARIIDVTTLRDVHVGLPMGMFGFVFHGKRYTSNDYNMECTAETVQPRDFLCAVTTLEEAQCWVVALNWAVQRKRRLEEEEWHDLDDYNNNNNNNMPFKSFRIKPQRRAKLS